MVHARILCRIPSAPHLPALRRTPQVRLHPRGPPLPLHLRLSVVGATPVAHFQWIVLVQGEMRSSGEDDTLRLASKHWLLP